MKLHMFRQITFILMLVATVSVAQESSQERASSPSAMDGAPRLPQQQETDRVPQSTNQVTVANIADLQKKVALLEEKTANDEKNHVQVDGRMTGNEVWLAALSVLVVFIAGSWISWRIRDESQLLARKAFERIQDDLASIAEKLEEVSKESGGAIPPVVDEASIANSSGKPVIHIAGRYLHSSPKVLIDGQACEIQSYSYDKIFALLPRSFGHKSEKLNVVVETEAGPSMLRIEYPPSKLEIVTPSVTKAGGHTVIKGRGFTSNTSVWVNVEPGQGRPIQSGYVDAETILVDWPSGNVKDPTTLVLLREDDEQARWDGAYK